ncbi:aldo keto reductase [Stemphylium lycopersici]|nr:aldo keto reductase [Stemphylium lycopersici]
MQLRWDYPSGFAVGAYGPTTSNHNFCEEDYIITPYIGEFVNTLTNMIYGSFQPSLNQFTRTKSRSHDAHVVIYGIHGLRRVTSKPEGGLISTLAFPYWGLIGVGVLSAWFHATLKYHSQMGDDLSMFLAVGAVLHQLLCYQATAAERQKYTAYILGSLIPISIYHVWADEIIMHEIAFAVMIYLVSKHARALIKKQVADEAARKKLDIKMPQLVGKNVGPVGYGLMGLTWRQNPPPAEQSYEAMRTALSLGANNWNGGELYGTPERNSLHLLNEYFTKYPGDADKIVLSLKGGLKKGEMMPDGSRENVRRSIDECLRVLDGKKSLDLFECARVDPNTPIEDTVSYIAEYVKDGKLGGISLSEVGAQSIRKAHSVHPISAVEVEFSLWSTDILQNGVAATCAELGITIVAYSPLGRGFLTGKYKKHSDIEPDSLLLHMDRFQPEVFDENIKLLHAVEDIAKAKGATPAQIALGWVLAQSGTKGMPTIIPIPGATTSARIEENTKPAKLSDEDMKALDDILKKFPIKGGRYNKAMSQLLFA